MALLELTDECRTAIEGWDGRFGSPSPQNRGKRALRVFKNGFVERVFATSHPILPGLWFGPIIVYGLYAGIVASWMTALPLFAAGVLIWTLIEYFLHRFVFHLRPGAGFEGKKRQFMMHGYHHEFPNDGMRLVAPPIMSWPLAIVVAGLMRLALGPVWWLPLFAGTAAGYLAYDWVHYYTHHFTPTTRLGKYLRRMHMVHHHASSEVNFGISNPLWDAVLRTYRDHDRARPGEKSESAPSSDRSAEGA